MPPIHSERRRDTPLLLNQMKLLLGGSGVGIHWFLAALDLSAPSQDNKLETPVALKETGHVLCGRRVLSILLIQRERKKRMSFNPYSKLRCRSCF